MNALTDQTPFYKRLCYNLLSIGLLLLLLYLGQAILVPFCFAVLLASLLLPANRFLEKKGLPRVVAITLSLTFSLIVISSIVYFLGNQISNFLDDLPTIQERLQSLSRVVQKWVRATFSITIREQNQYLNDTASQMTESQGGLLQQTFGTVTDLLSYMLLLPIYSFLILYYRDMIKKFLVDVFTNSNEASVKEILYESQSVSLSFIAGLMIEMTVVFALNATGFLILGIKYALFLALVAALLNLIPYIGMLIANIFCMLITLISGDAMNLPNVLWVGIILAVVQLIDNNILMSLIVGSKIRINALSTIIGVLIGGVLCGVPGMFLSIPALAVLKVIFDRVEGLKPYGMLLGDDRLVRRQGKFRLQ